MISTLVISFDIDFKNISEGLTRDKSRNPNLQKKKLEIKNITVINNFTTKQQNKTNPWILFLKDPSGAFSKPIQALFIYDPQQPKSKNEMPIKRKTREKKKNVTLLAM